MVETASAQAEKPLPVKRSVILNRRNVTYIVEGRQTIPWGCVISIARDVKIMGRGNNPVLVVAGALKIHGTRNHNVFIENLIIEPAQKFNEIRLDMVSLSAGGIRSAKDTPAKGSVVVENSQFASNGVLDVSLIGGQVLILGSSFLGPINIRGAIGKGKKRSALDVNIQGCCGTGRRGFGAGLFITGAYRTVVRNCYLGGDKSEFNDCVSLTIDACKISSGVLVLHGTNFSKTKLQKTDFYCEQLVLSAPPRARQQRVLIDKSWFQGMTSAREIDEKIIRDGKDDKKCGVVAMFKQIKRQHVGLAGGRDR